MILIQQIGNHLSGDPLKSSAASETERTALSQKETAAPGISKPTAYRSTLDKAYALRPKPKKKPKFFLKNPPSGLDGPWGAVSFVFGRFRVLNREIGQIWHGAAAPAANQRFWTVLGPCDWLLDRSDGRLAMLYGYWDRKGVRGGCPGPSRRHPPIAGCTTRPDGWPTARVSVMVSRDDGHL